MQHWKRTFTIPASGTISGSLFMYATEKSARRRTKKFTSLTPAMLEFHRLWSAGNTSPTIIIISFSAFGDSFGKLGDGIFTLDGEMEKSLKNALNLIKQCILFDDDIQNQFASNTLENILLTLLRKQIPVSRQKKTIGTQNYKAVLKVMNDNLEKSLSADRIAKLCGLSLSNLKKTFKKYSGMGVMEYYNSLKITKAMEMINDDIPMYEISEKLGFSSPNYFSDSFKRQCKMTPTEYKKVYGSIITAPAERQKISQADVLFAFPITAPY